MARRKLPYKKPTIIRNKSGDWYIQYYYLNPDIPGKWEPFKERKGINYIKDLSEKEKAAEDLRFVVEQWLKAGNSPFGDVQKVADEIIEKYGEVKVKKEYLKSWTIAKAIEEFRKFLIKQKYKERTVETYNNYLYNYERYLAETNKGNTIACEISEVDVIEFLDLESDNLDWSGRTYNNYLEFYGTFFNRCKKLEKTIRRKIQYEFDISDIDLKNTTPQKNKAFTPVLVKKVKEEATKLKYFDLLEYLEWIFLSLMRPEEIINIKFSDVDEQSRQIRLIGKTGDRIVPISNQLMKLINKRQKRSSGHTDYIFGEAGKVINRKIGGDYFREQFKTVRKKVPLDDRYGPYSFKPTGVIRMINAGFSDREIMVLTGHKTQAAFEAYKRDLVIDNSHLMKGSTIDF